MFKVMKGENAVEILKYDYKWLVKVDVFDDFEVWNTDSSKVPKDKEITEDELEKLRKEREQSWSG